MVEIYIEWHGVGIESNHYKHMYLVYRPDGYTDHTEWEIIRGGPESLSPLFGDLVVSTYGLQDAESGERYDSSAEADPEGYAVAERGSRLLSSNFDSTDWQALQDLAMSLGGPIADASSAGQYDYEVASLTAVNVAPTLNSNSLIASVLASA